MRHAARRPAALSGFVCALLVLGLAGPARAAPCDDWHLEAVGEYWVENNVWNKGPLTGYQQCVYIEPAPGGVRAGWTWSWPLVDIEVKSYPAVIFGWKPVYERSTTPQLPIRIREAASVLVQFSARYELVGAANLALDAWITSGTPPAVPNVTREVMIWVDAGGLLPHGTRIDTVVIGGREFDLYANQGPFSYFAFVATTPFLQGLLDLQAFLAYLVDRGLISPDEVLASVEMGNEVVGGTGWGLLDHFSVAVQPRPPVELALALNAPAYRPGDVQLLSVELSALRPLEADVYLVVRTPAGELFSATPSGDLTPGLQPFRTGVAVPEAIPLRAPSLFGGPVPPAPAGTYAWLAALTRPGTLELVSNLAQLEWRLEE
jgi:hypothetical protein